MNDVIVTRNLSKHYGKIRALDALSLSIPAGSIYGLLGPNGAGKTTALDLIVNLQAPSSGSATVLGVDSRLLRQSQLAKVGYVSENQELPGWMTIEQLLAFLKPFYPTWDDQRANDLLRQFQLPPDRKLKTLSRGMRMKTLLASAMAFHPKLLVLDEPLSGLDPLTREELMEALLETAVETTVVLSSHDLSEIETFITHVAFLRDGHLEFAEDLAALTARFREIVLTLDEVSAPKAWPAHWIGREVGSGSVRFIDTEFDAERTLGRIRMEFKGIRQIETDAMSLRSIFVAVARRQSATQ